MGHLRQIVVPHSGYKNHVGTDRTHDFVRRFTVTHAAAHDGTQLKHLLDQRGRTPELPRTKPRGMPMPAHIARGNATRGRMRARVEHVLAAQKRRFDLVIRTIGLARATAKITLANLAYDFKRLAWLQGRTALA